MDRKPHSMEDLLMELLIENGPEAILTVFTAAYNMGMKVERERFTGAEHYERAEGCRAFANGYKPKRIDTSAGTATLSVPKTAGHGDTPFHPKALRRGRRCTRAVMLCLGAARLGGRAFFIGTGRAGAGRESLKAGPGPGALARAAVARRDSGAQVGSAVGSVGL